MNRALFPAFAIFTTLYSLAPAHAQSYKLTDTGHVGDNLTASGTAYSISPTGEVGGQSEPTFYYGYTWQNGAVTELDDVKDATGFTYVRGINSAGVAVGSCSDYFSPHERFARWQGKAVTNLGSLSGGTGTTLADAEAYAINDNGLIVGWSDTTASYQEHAVYYDTAFHTLPFLAGAPADAYAQAHAVNASGEIAGYCYADENNTHATLWKGGKAYDLGALGGTKSQADGINDAGQVVGFYTAQPNADGIVYDRAFLWTPTTTNGTTGTMEDLGTLPGVGSSYAADINNNGQVVGSDGNGDVFLWDAAHGLQDLNKLITSISTEVQPNNGNYYLNSADAINDSGQIAATFTIFISNGSSDHVTHGCILDPGGAVVTKPAAPNNLKVVGGAQFVGGPQAAATGKISLTWADNSSNETSFVLQRSTGAGSFADFQTLPANTTSYADGTVTVGTSYGYRVRAANSAGSSSYSNTATATASAPSTVTISSVVLTPTSVTAGSTSSGKITLSAVAPTGGATISLKSSDTASATVPASVTIAAGNKSISFTVTSKTVTSTKTVTITATIGSSSKTATLTVTPATSAVTIQSLSLSPTSVAGGSSSTGTLTLSGPAPAGGLAVTQTSSDTSAATLAGTVNIAAGATSAKFKITTYAVTSTKTVTITSSAAGASKTATLTVTGSGGTGTVTAKSLTASPSSVSSNGQTACTLTLSGAAPTGGASVPISANGTVFYTAVVAAGQTSVTFNVNWGVVSSTTTNTLSATYGGKTVTATVTVSPTAVTLKAFTFYPNPVTGGQTTVGKVTLSAVAPAGGAVINITYNGSAFYQFVIAAGKFDGIYSQPTNATTATQKFVFVANYNGASISKTLTVNP